MTGSVTNERERARVYRLFPPFLACLVLVSGLLSRPGIYIGDSINSRLATVYALAHHGTWCIDVQDGPPNPFESGTVDKVVCNGRLISSKPPLLPLLMTLVYVPFRMAGWTLDRPETLKPFAALVIFLFCQVPFAMGLWAFTRVTSWMPPVPWMVLGFLLAFASPLFGYAQQFSNHVPAAAALCGALWCAWQLMKPGATSSGRKEAFGFGLLAGLVFALDMPVTLYCALAGLMLLSPRHARIWPWILMGLLPPVLLQSLCLWIATGTPFPVQLRPDLYWYEWSYWRHPLGVDALNESKGIYCFHVLFGRYGIFMLYPVFLFGLLSGILIMRKKVKNGLKAIEKHDDWGSLVLLLWVGFWGLTAYYVLKTNNYGGASYGFRWHLASYPVLALCAAPMIENIKNWRGWLILMVLTAVSLYSSWECLGQPWGDVQSWAMRWIFGPAA
ncbi:MAG TPA: hypothetical protein PK349_00045 [Candidatus Hydrogenedentes bacterium]|nr:hypothetical protein [Candidatus Hydrogenedentota bacterium]